MAVQRTPALHDKTARTRLGQACLMITGAPTLNQTSQQQQQQLCSCVGTDTATCDQPLHPLQARALSGWLDHVEWKQRSTLVVGRALGKLRQSMLATAFLAWLEEVQAAKMEVTLASKQGTEVRARQLPGVKEVPAILFKSQKQRVASHDQWLCLMSRASLTASCYSTNAHGS